MLDKYDKCRVMEPPRRWSSLMALRCSLMFICPQPPKVLIIMKVKSDVAQSCPTLGNSMDCSLPGCSAHGIFQVRVLEWVAISFSMGSSLPSDRTQVSHIVGRWFTILATREVIKLLVIIVFSYFMIQHGKL